MEWEVNNLLTVTEDLDCARHRTRFWKKTLKMTFPFFESWLMQEKRFTFTRRK